MYTGNGVRDDNEKGIPNVKVELVEVFMNKSKSQQTELLTEKKQELTKMETIFLQTYQQAHIKLNLHM